MTVSFRSLPMYSEGSEVTYDTCMAFGKLFRVNLSGKQYTVVGPSPQSDVLGTFDSVDEAAKFAKKLSSGPGDVESVTLPVERLRAGDRVVEGGQVFEVTEMSESLDYGYKLRLTCVKFSDMKVVVHRQRGDGVLLHRAALSDE